MRLAMSMPLAVWSPRKTIADKKIITNLNVYRNLHSRVANECKILYKEEVRKRVMARAFPPFTEEVQVTFQYFKPTKRISDKSNVDSVHRKYFYDALVELGILVDDNDDYIKEELMLPTVLDRDNPRVDFIMGPNLFTIKRIDDAEDRHERSN